jgi:hypothetical protein
MNHTDFDFDAALKEVSDAIQHLDSIPYDSLAGLIEAYDNLIRHLSLEQSEFEDELNSRR